MKENKEISRREFSKNLAKLLLFGGLTHFGINAFSKGEHTGVDCPGGGMSVDNCEILHSKGNAMETDYCPGGAPAEDVCLPQEDLRDYCPGEKLPEDECSPSGARNYNNLAHSDDECNTGLPEHDICDNAIVESDQCPAMNETTDICNPDQDAEFDKCYSGLPNDDVCDADGGRATDECPGGGVLRDTCETPTLWTEKGSGDECSLERQEHEAEDSCKTAEDRKILGAEVQDYCGFDHKNGTSSADVCFEGTNQQITNWGGEDICIAFAINGWKPYGDGSDTCLDGSEEQDFCGTANGSDGRKEIDVCIPTELGDIDDLCNPSLKEGLLDVGSDDYCFNGHTSSDECKTDLGDEDECPGGRATLDECSFGTSDMDECPGGMPSVDVCLPGMVNSDECVASLAGSDESPDDCTVRAAEVAE